VLEARLTKMHVHVDETRDDVESFGDEDLGSAFLEPGVDRCNFAAFNEYVLLRVDSVNRINDVTILDE
jgi:hypothetical protein